MEQLVIGPVRRFPRLGSSLAHITLGNTRNYEYTRGQTIYGVHKNIGRVGVRDGIRDGKIAAILNFWWNPELRADPPGPPSRIWFGRWKPFRWAAGSG